MTKLVRSCAWPNLQRLLIGDLVSTQRQAANGSLHCRGTAASSAATSHSRQEHMRNPVRA